MEAMSLLEVERAKIIKLLEAKWKCSKEGHRHCYVKGAVHGRLTQNLLSTWASYIVSRSNMLELCLI